MAPGAAWYGKVEVELPVSGVIRIERHSEQALLVCGSQLRMDVEKRRRIQLTSREIQNVNLPGLPYNKQPPSVARWRRDKDRRRQSESDAHRAQAGYRLRASFAGACREDTNAKANPSYMLHPIPCPPDKLY